MGVSPMRADARGGKVGPMNAAAAPTDPSAITPRRPVAAAA